MIGFVEGVAVGLAIAPVIYTYTGYIIVRSLIKHFRKGHNVTWLRNKAA